MSTIMNKLYASAAAATGSYCLAISQQVAQLSERHRAAGWANFSEK